MNEKGLEREMELNGGEENLNLNRVEVSAIDENEKSENGKIKKWSEPHEMKYK
jgi:hypothetical protein